MVAFLLVPVHCGQRGTREPKRRSFLNLRASSIVSFPRIEDPRGEVAFERVRARVL